MQAEIMLGFTSEPGRVRHQPSLCHPGVDMMFLDHHVDRDDVRHEEEVSRTAIVDEVVDFAVRDELYLNPRRVKMLEHLPSERIDEEQLAFLAVVDPEQLPLQFDGDFRDLIDACECECGCGGKEFCIKGCTAEDLAIFRPATYVQIVNRRRKGVNEVFDLVIPFAALVMLGFAPHIQHVQ